MKFKYAVSVISYLILLNFCLETKASLAAPVPIVIWHGLGDSCCNPLSMGSIKTLLEKSIPGVYVKSIMIGSNIGMDMWHSYFDRINRQIADVCNQIAQDSKLTHGYHGLGFSQGGQFLRAIVQRCPRPNMINLVSIGGQHQGVYSLPKCPGENSTICDYVRELISKGAYLDSVQQRLVPAQYWHDSENEQEYKTKSLFLADINNENIKNSTYKTNLMRLKNFVMLKFLGDTVVDPRESEWFGFYKPGEGKQIYTLQESALYKEDWLGLQQMDKAGKLHFLSYNGDHLRFDSAWFVKQIVSKFLK